MSQAVTRITVPTATGVATLRPSTGRPARSYTLPRPPPGSSVSRIGTGFLVSSTSGTVVYR